MAAIAVSGILMAGIAPTWRYLVIRDREEELIFRGEQYKLAIERYKKRFNALPTKLEDLDKYRMIRKLYDDPMTRGPFELVFSTPSGPRRASLLAAQQESKLSSRPVGSGMGIIGVVSMSTDEAIRPYKDKKHYNEWEFVAEEKEEEKDDGDEDDGNEEEGDEAEP